MKKLTVTLLALALALSCLSAMTEDATTALSKAGVNVELKDVLPDELADGAYRVVVRDTAGNPVEGAIIQLCDDATCAFQPTDAEGVAAFSVEEQKAYEVHVLAAPEGYAPDETVYQTEETFSELSITLKRAE